MRWKFQVQCLYGIPLACKFFFSIVYYNYLGKIAIKISHWGPSAVAQVVKGPHLARPGSHMGASSNPGSPTSLLAPCLWPGKAVQDGPKLWDPAPAWETRKRLLASDRHSIGPLRSLGEWIIGGRSSSLSLLSIYIRLSNEKIIKINLLKKKPVFLEKIHNIAKS